MRVHGKYGPEPSSGSQGGPTPGPQDRLAARMRAVKERSGLSYGRLAAKTHYSRSSWERFLNGKQVPSRTAVEQFAAAAGEGGESLLALLDEVLTAERAASAAAGAVSAGAVSAESLPAGPVPAAPAPGPDAEAPSPSGAAAREETGSRSRWASAWLPTARALGYVTLGALLGSVISVLALAPGGGKAGDKGDEDGTAARPQASAGTDGAAGKDARSTPAAGTIKVGCSSDSCLRREPQAMDCQWDATTVRQTWLRGMQIELRYSAACQAVWGRIESGAIGDSVTIKDKGGHELSAEIRVERDTYTRMLAVAADRPWQDVTICGRIPRFHEQECSPVGAVQP